jgi:hypothetical protein
MEQHEQKKKYRFTGGTKTIETEHGPVTLRQIQAARDGLVGEGSLGGWIEKEENLPQSGLDGAWIFPDSEVYGDAVVRGDARVYGSRIHGKAVVGGNAYVYGSTIRGNARVFGGTLSECLIQDEAVVMGNTRLTDVKAYDHASIHGDSGKQEVFVKHTQLMGLSSITGSASVSACSLWDHASIRDSAMVYNSMLYGMAEINKHAVADSVDMFDHAVISYNSTVQPKGGSGRICLVDDVELFSVQFRPRHDVDVLFCGDLEYQGKIPDIPEDEPYLCIGKPESSLAYEMLAAMKEAAQKRQEKQEEDIEEEKE